MIAALVLAVVACQEPSFAPDPAEWEARDLEGRWVLIERETLEHGWTNVDPLVSFLEQRQEAQLLEWLCLYPRSEGQAAKFLAALAELDAPQWARAAMWVARDRDSHTFGSAYKELRARPGLAVDWLRRHEARLHVPLETVLQQLGEAASAAPVDSSRLLPPWSEEEALAHLIEPGEVVDFGERLRAEPGITYLHQVERELRAVAHAQVYGTAWVERVRAWTRHARAEIRSFAWIALGDARRAPSAPLDLRDAEFEGAVADPLEDDAVRASALLAWSRRAEWSPGAWSALHEVALESDHPAWVAAVSSLRDVGDEFTILQLEGVLRRLEKGDPARKAWVADAVKSLRAASKQAPLAARNPTQALERTAWMELVGGPFETQRAEWTRAQFAPARLAPELREKLAALAKGYVPEADLAAELPAAASASWTERVRAWASSLAR